jgi:hypothetical protein
MDASDFVVEFKYPCGVEAKDKITGFTGIITVRLDFLYGCTQYGLTPTVNDKGETKHTEYFDEGRIQVIGEGVKPTDVRVEKRGGDNRDAPRS